MNIDNFIVRPKRRHVERFQDFAAWDELDLADRQDLREHVAGLPSAFQDDALPARQFDMLALNGQLLLVQEDPDLERVRRRIVEIAGDLELLGNIPSVARQMDLILEVQTEDFWTDVTPESIEEVRRRLRDLVQLIEPRRRKIVITDFLDEIGEGVEVPADQVGPGVDIGRFRMKVRRFLEQHIDHLAVQKLRRAQQLTEQDLLELERMLRDAGVEEERFGDLATEGKLGVFLRSLIGLDRTAAKEALSEAVRGHSLSGDQVEFLNLIIDHLVDNGTVDPRRFYESPFTDIHEGGLGEVFPAELGKRIVETIRRIDRTAAA